MRDTVWIDALRALKLPVIDAPRIGKVIRLADIPLDLREDFDALRVGSGCPIVDGEVCIWPHDWEAFRSIMLKRAHHDMHALSLQLGAQEPGPDDLAAAPLMSDWVLIRDPTYGGAILLGVPSGHPTSRGPVSNTSRLCGFDPVGHWARTVTRWYRLGEMSTINALASSRAPRLLPLGLEVLTFEEARRIIAADRERLA